MSHLYFIALVPPEEICREVNGFKNDASKMFGSHHALKSPPHITLIPPFKWKASEMNQLQGHLLKTAANSRTFTLQLDNFSSFPPRVIFISVDNPPELVELHTNLRNTCSMLNIPQDNRPYHPHLTIAFKDLKRKHYHEAFTHFNSIQYERVFNADSIYLLRHDGRKWNFFKSFKIGK